MNLADFTERCSAQFLQVPSLGGDERNMGESVHTLWEGELQLGVGGVYYLYRPWGGDTCL